MDTLEIEAFYLTPEKESKKGKFILRRLTMLQNKQLLSLCQKRHPQTNEILETDQAKFTTLALATAIYDCPLSVKTQAWKDCPDLVAKATVIDESIESDTFVFLEEKMKSMDRYSKQTENL